MGGVVLMAATAKSCTVRWRGSMANRTASTKTKGTAARSVRERIGRADRVHRATSADGTAIVGEVYGQGAPLVLVHAGLGHGTLDWAFALPSLTDQFTCYCMSTRGRGSSGEAGDHSIERNVEDVSAFVESIGAPVALAGLAAEGRLVDAARDWMTEWANDEEMAFLAASGWLETCATHVPVLLRLLEASADDDGYSPTDPSVLGQVEGAGHCGVWMQAECYAEAMKRFVADGHPPR